MGITHEDYEISCSYPPNTIRSHYINIDKAGATIAAPAFHVSLFYFITSFNDFVDKSVVFSFLCA